MGGTVMINNKGRKGSSTKPKVTIAIPTFNRGKFLAQCVESALNQTYSNIEVIISNNASTDDTLSQLTKYNDGRLILIQQKTNIGMVPNWNECLNIASGDFFILLSDDDYLESNAIEEMINSFLSGKNEPSLGTDDIGIVCCRARVVDENNEEIRLGKQGPYVESSENIVISFFSGLRDMYPCKILFRTSDARMLNGYQGNKFPLAADAFMWMMIVMRRGCAVFIDEILSNYRIHSGAATQQTNYRVWMKEITDLGNACVEYLRSQSKMDNIKKIQEAANHWNCKIISGSLITNLSTGTSRRDAIYELLRYRALFMKNQREFILLFRSLIRILLPQKIIKTLKRIRGSGAAVTT
jgi:glycosyltransferase involved in cell wall biosynthesis